jgi:peptidoglycan hydrolase CwlO-like protein
MAAPQFLTDFQNTMTQLNNMRGQIEGKLQFNTNFNNTLLEKVNNIRTLVEQLSDKIRGLKGSITGIQGRVDDNTRDITEKQGECEALQNELRSRDFALENLQRENNNLQARIRNGEDAQKRIPELEAQINDLNIRINKYSDAIKYSDKQLIILKNKDKDKKETIANLTKERDESNRQREELNNRIREGDAARADLASSKSKEASFSKENNDMKAEIANLNAQITSLTNNNEFYKNKIIEATAALNTAIGYLNQFITSPPREANLGELTRIVNNITELINQISGVLDGNPMASPQSGGMSSAVRVAPNNPRSNTNNLRNRRAIMSANLSSNSPTTNVWNQGRKGGKKSIKRKTKKRKYNKYNKQKGGFTYKTTNKRRSITTSMPSSPITSARSLSDSARGRKRRGTSSRTQK